METFKSASFKKAYNILCAALTPNKERAGLFPTLCQIPAAGETSPHSHFEEEIFILVRGTGKLRYADLENQDEILTEGSLVKIPAGRTHQLINLSSEPMEFVSIYTEDYSLPAPPEAVLITAAPPTPNGPLHLGHISGPYLAADSIGRYFSLRGSQVKSSSGTDDHQNYVERQASLRKQSLENFVSEQRQRILKGLDAFQIKFDEFLEPRKDVQHRETTIIFLQRLLERKIAHRVSIDFPYCEACDIYLSDAYLAGQCPDCTASSSGACESCGQVYSASEILSPSCAHCKSPASHRQAQVVEFPLSEYFHTIQKDLDRLNLPKRVQEMLQKFHSMKNRKILLTHPTNSSLGIELSPGETIHVWTEMAVAYEEFAHSNSSWISCFGFDNSFYYLALIPALLRALDTQSKLPDQVVVNEFLLLDHLKFSTSRNHAIWADELKSYTKDTENIEIGAIDAEILRIYLLLQRPVYGETNFSLDDYLRFQNTFGKQKSELLKLSKVSRPIGNSQSLTNSLLLREIAQLNRVIKDFESCFDLGRTDLRKASAIALSLLETTLAEKSQQSLNLSRVLVLKQFFGALMPTFAEQLAKNLETLSETPMTAPKVNWIQDVSGYL